MAKNKRNDRKLWFRCVKAVLKVFVRKPKFVFLGEQFRDQSIILCNHIGMSGPLANELYFPNNFRFLGTYEMNSGLKEVYKYLSLLPRAPHHRSNRQKTHHCRNFLQLIQASLPHARGMLKSVLLCRLYRVRMLYCLYRL